jgi:hypothetical protein
MADGFGIPILPAKFMGYLIPSNPDQQKQHQTTSKISSYKNLDK